MAWARSHLFRTWYDSVLTVVFGSLGFYVVYRAVRFVFITGRWHVITDNLPVLLIGRFPRDQLPKLYIAIALLAIGIALIARRPAGRLTLAGCGFVGAAAALLNTTGGIDRWGGLLLTVFLAVFGIVLSFPIGVLLALGRRSSLPVVRAVCTGYIELIRGVPLVTLLFMGALVIGFLVPSSIRPSLVVRALIALVMFTSAYIAEIVRGGLLAVPRAQTEAAQAVGLSTLSTMRLIVLPQALRAVIPALVGQFISLFKDTSLVTTIGLFELLRAARSLTSRSEFLAQGLQAEILTFAAFIYWIGSFTMSRASRRLELRLERADR